MARNNLLSTFIGVQAGDHGFKYNQGSQWSSSSGSHCSCYLFSKKPLSFWCRRFQGDCKGLFATCRTMGEKIRILSLPRGWAAGGRIFFSSFSLGAL